MLSTIWSQELLSVQTYNLKVAGNGTTWTVRGGWKPGALWHLQLEKNPENLTQKFPGARLNLSLLCCVMCQIARRLLNAHWHDLHPVHYSSSSHVSCNWAMASGVTSSEPSLLRLESQWCGYIVVSRDNVPVHDGKCRIQYFSNLIFLLWYLVRLI